MLIMRSLLKHSLFAKHPIDSHKVLEREMRAYKWYSLRGTISILSFETCGATGQEVGDESPTHGLSDVWITIPANF